MYYLMKCNFEDNLFLFCIYCYFNLIIIIIINQIHRNLKIPYLIVVENLKEKHDFSIIFYNESYLSIT